MPQPAAILFEIFDLDVTLISIPSGPGHFTFFPFTHDCHGHRNNVSIILAMKRRCTAL